MKAIQVHKKVVKQKINITKHVDQDPFELEEKILDKTLLNQDPVGKTVLI